MVFIYSPDKSELWLISHAEIFEDIELKLVTDRKYGLAVIEALEKVCRGEEPEEVLLRHDLKTEIGLSIELILKAYKWIWGQEDVNYPNGEGRWKSMNWLLKLKEDFS